MQCRLLLNVVVAESSAVLELFTGENKTLLIWRNTLLILDLRFDVVDSVARFDLKSDGLAGDYLKNDVSRMLRWR